ncbi:MAG: response regulator transcription factor [Candidatus Thiodiazotropha lotti]|uniref:DNA-binding response regulator n=1 Tax=Candidatus Thiodiazotropha endoloripes TaxID=1818881 RepID=A0A1E2UJF0_9GAMM|nr:response regulator transcription factor [Candidatus Thiodiazotropha endoloripes]MCG7898983.1 response regulator transcription factor [Candidatus Thiodiazotropha weberae]MCG7992793.1 response regulator transcription factor [Candidatus Thiodiazotropha lotti]MCG7901758.1 response regulator transcription factor [Candidatus Thiodiazotropha weberae]MCG7912373.1 response regulator transcription factor [Candidatus Thiodiazotropha weberae]MCG7998858.1 response regulator transcription factor [Candida
MDQTTPTVYVVDDDEEVRSALKLLFESVGLPVICFASALEYLDRFDESLPGCLVVDIRMPGMSGLDMQEKLNELPLHPPVIIITGHGDVPMAVRAVQAGAVDFIEKPFRDQILLDSVHRAIEMDAEKRGEASRLSEIRDHLNQLTPREREVLDLVISGMRNKNISEQLGITLSTVEAHRSRVMEKMQADSLSHLMRMMLTLENE